VTEEAKPVSRVSSWVGPKLRFLMGVPYRTYIGWLGDAGGGAGQVHKVGSYDRYLEVG